MFWVMFPFGILVSSIYLFIYLFFIIIIIWGWGVGYESSTTTLIIWTSGAQDVRLFCEVNF